MQTVNLVVFINCDQNRNNPNLNELDLTWGSAIQMTVACNYSYRKITERSKSEKYEINTSFFPPRILNFNGTYYHCCLLHIILENNLITKQIIYIQSFGEIHVLQALLIILAIFGGLCIVFNVNIIN